MRHALLIVPVVLALVTGIRRRIVVDDGFIYLRIVQNVVAGNGPVLNAGERVEAYTSPIWLAVLTVGDLVLPLRSEWVAVVLGLSLVVVGLVAAMDGALRLARDRDAHPHPTISFPAGALVFTATFGVWAWHTSGMETGLVVAWLGMSLWVLARWAEERSPLGLAGQVLVGLGWLIRPELVMFSALFMFLVLAGDRRYRSWSGSLRAAVGIMAVPIAYQIFRMGYFGALVANTAIVKEGTSVHLNRGTSYLEDFVRPYHLWLPLAVLALGAAVPLVRGVELRRRAVYAVFAVGGLSNAAWAVAVGGDYMHGRFFVPALFALCAPVAAVPLRRSTAGAVLVVPWAIAAVAFLRPPQLGGLPVEGQTFVASQDGRVTTEDWGWVAGSRPMASDLADTLHVDHGVFNYAVSPADFEVADDLPTPAVIAAAIGLVSYALGPDVHVVDTLGLAHPIGSRFESNASDAGLPGHDKPLSAAWLAALVAAPGQELTPGQLGLTGADMDEVSPERFAREVSQARRALACAGPARVERSVRGRLGPRRFLRNIWDAPANTFLRIPVDPAEAVAELC